MQGHWRKRRMTANFTVVTGAFLNNFDYLFVQSSSSSSTHSSGSISGVMGSQWLGKIMDISTSHLYRFYLLLKATIVMLCKEIRTASWCRSAPTGSVGADASESHGFVLGCYGSCAAVECRNHGSGIWLGGSKPIPCPTILQDTQTVAWGYSTLSSQDV